MKELWQAFDHDSQNSESPFLLKILRTTLNSGHTQARSQIKAFDALWSRD
jgi:hypothetical protein